MFKNTLNRPVPYFYRGSLLRQKNKKQKTEKSNGILKLTEFSGDRAKISVEVL